MRRLRRWWPVLAALVFLAVVILGVVALYFAATNDSGLFAGSWQRVGDTDSRMTVAYEGERCSITLTEGDASQTVPATAGFNDIVAVLPLTTDPALLGGQTVGATGLPIRITAEPENGTLIVSSDTGPGATTVTIWTYEPASFFARSARGWAAQALVACAFLVVAVLLFGNRSEVKSGRDKARMLVVVLVGAVLAFGLLTQTAGVLLLARPLVAACWALFLVTVAPSLVPVIGEGLGVIFLPSRRRAFRQGLVSQDEQGERGDAMERVLHDAIDERGDRDQTEGDDSDA